MLYKTVCRLAKKKGLSINQLELKADLHGVIGKWRDYNPRMKNLKKVADALGISVTTLLREAEKDEREEGDAR